MKKFLTFMLMLTAVFLFAACGGGEEDENVAVTGVTINAVEKTEYALGEALVLTAKVTPDNATVKKVTWSSSDTNIAIIDADTGVVTFVATGTVVFTATSKENAALKASTAEITVVKPELVGITIAGSQNISLGTAVGLLINTTPEFADGSVTWSSADEGIATVNEDGEVTGHILGTTKIYAVSKVNPEITAEYTVNVVEASGVSKPDSITITGAETCYLGYDITLSATVYPLTSIQTVTWASSSPQILKIDENTGVCTALKVGEARIRATSVDDPSVKSDLFKVTVVEDTSEPTAANMQGYKIVIMNASSDLGSIDPFLDTYTKSDKAIKQQVWTAVETKYNCDLSVEAYPDTAPWGNERIAYINDNATQGTSPADLYTVSSAWIYKFVAAESALDVTEYYNTYGKSQMQPAQQAVGSIKGKIYVASTGKNKTASQIDQGLFYNYEKIKALGLEDPAEMFNNGLWTYTNFEDWARRLQAKLDATKSEYALGGHSIRYFLGMTNAAGIQVTDANTAEINIDSLQSKNAMALMSRLVADGVCNPNANWYEGFPGEPDRGFQEQTTLMVTGTMGYVNNANRWPSDMWGEGKTNIGYVPFPYPDTTYKHNTRVAISDQVVYMYAKGRDHAYPSGIGAEQVYRVVNEMFLTTIMTQNSDPTFDAETELRNALSAKFSNEASVEAAMYYDSSKVIFDPTLNTYDSTGGNIFNAASKSIMYEGADYQQVMESLRDSFQQKVIEIFG